MSEALQDALGEDEGVGPDRAEDVLDGELEDDFPADDCSDDEE